MTPPHDESAPTGAARARRRLTGAILALPCLMVLGVGAWLTPDERGYGTHTQINNDPSCGYMARTGWPCPGCGLTTSVTAMMHGRVGLALRAQPFGVLLWAVLVLGSIGGLLQAATGRAVVSRFRPRWWWLLIGVALLLAGWGINAGLGAMAGRYPVGR
jgi:hypothetical protein